MTRWRLLLALALSVALLACSSEIQSPADEPDGAAPSADTASHPENTAEPDAGLPVPGEPDLLPDAAPSTPADTKPLEPGVWSLEPLAIASRTIAAGSSVKLVLTVKAPADRGVTGGEVRIEAKAPGGATSLGKTPVDVTAGETKSVEQERGPYTLLGTWTFSPALYDGAGALLAKGASVDVTVKLPVGTVKMDVPYTAQPDGVTCGTTSLKMSMAFYGVTKSVSTIASYQESYDGSPYSEGSSHASLLAAAKHFGFTGAHQFSGWDALKQQIVSGHPCVVNMESVINPGGGHYTVVTGLTFDAGGHVTEVYLNDPSCCRRSYSGSRFEELWSFRAHWGMSVK